MDQRRFSRFFVALLLAGLFVGVSACGSTGKQEPAIQEPGSTAIPPLSLTPTEALLPAGMQSQNGQVRQWASEATASSEFADPEWSAAQATGAPNTGHCGDYQTAWASAGSDSIATLELTFPISVRVTGVNVIQSFNPDQIVRVELVGSFERSVTIYEGLPTQIEQPCPYVLAITLPKTQEAYNRVRLTLDQSVLGLGWNQIDAVELVGETD